MRIDETTVVDDQAYLAALAANPDDDAVRLVWADALQARGEPRGELIALQLAEARATAAGDLDAAEVAADAAAELLADHEDALTPPALARATSRLTLRFRRGFIETVRLDAARFEACADDLFAATPVIDLILDDVDEAQARRIAGMPHLRQLRSLDVRDLEIRDAIAALLTSPHLIGLRTLRGTGVLHAATVDRLMTATTFAALERLDAPMTVVDRQRLLASSGLPALRELTGWFTATDLPSLIAPHRRERWTVLRAYCFDGLGGLLAAGLPALRELEVAGPVRGDTLPALVAADLPALRHLRLSNRSIAIDQLTAVLDAPLAGRLRTLDLSGTRLDDPAIGAALAGRALAGLRGLDVAHSDLDAAGLRALLTADLSGLEQLTLTATRIGDDGCRALAAAPGLTRLRRLDLEAARVTAAGVRGLAEGADLPALRELRLHDVELDGPAVAALGRPRGLPRLRALRVGGNAMNDRPAIALVTAPVVAQLSSLDLSGSRTSDATFAALAANPDARHLRALRLGPSAGVTVATVTALAGSPHLTRLREIDVRWWTDAVQRQHSPSRELVVTPTLHPPDDLPLRPSAASLPRGAPGAEAVALGRRAAFW